jgi:hypothetical protein
VPAEPAPPPLAAWPVAKTPPPAPLRIARAPVAAACPRQPSPQPDPVCAALDGKSATLRAQIARLEEKVKVLQTAAQSRVVAPPKPAPVVAKPVPPRPVVPAPRKLEPAPVKESPAKVAPVKERPAQAAPVKTAQAAPAMPWGWIGAGGVAVFAAVGAFRLWRRQRERRRMYAKLKARAGGTLTAEPGLG